MKLNATEADLKLSEGPFGGKFAAVASWNGKVVEKTRFETKL